MTAYRIDDLVDLSLANHPDPAEADRTRGVLWMFFTILSSDVFFGEFDGGTYGGSYDERLTLADVTPARCQYVLSRRGNGRTDEQALEEAKAVADLLVWAVYTHRLVIPHGGVRTLFRVFEAVTFPEGDVEQLSAENDRLRDRVADLEAEANDLADRIHGS